MLKFYVPEQFVKTIMIVVQNNNTGTGKSISKANRLSSFYKIGKLVAN